MVTPLHPSVPTQGSTLELHRVQHQEVGPSLPSTQGPILQQPKPPLAKLCRLSSRSSCPRIPQIILSHGPCLRRTSSLPLGQATLFPPVALPRASVLHDARGPAPGLAFLRGPPCSTRTPHTS